MFLILIYSFLFLILTFLHFLLRKLSQVLRALLIRITMHHSRERSLSSQRNIKVGIFRSWFWPIFSHFISPFFLCHSLFSPFLCHSICLSLFLAFGAILCLYLCLFLAFFTLSFCLSVFLSFFRWMDFVLETCNWILSLFIFRAILL